MIKVKIKADKKMQPMQNKKTRKKISLVSNRSWRGGSASNREVVHWRNYTVNYDINDLVRDTNLAIKHEIHGLFFHRT